VRWCPTTAAAAVATTTTNTRVGHDVPAQGQRHRRAAQLVGHVDEQVLVALVGEPVLIVVGVVVAVVVVVVVVVDG
jgi:hypothetical protein